MLSRVNINALRSIASVPSHWFTHEQDFVGVRTRDSYSFTLQSVPIVILNLSIVLFLMVSDYSVIASKLTILIALLLFSFTFKRSHSYCNNTDTALRSLLMRRSVKYRDLVPNECAIHRYKQ